MKIFLAGTGSVNPVLFKEVVEKYNPMILESFFYMNKNITSNLHNFSDFLLDSGAFTFIHNQKSCDFSYYQDKYIEFINHYKIKKFFELDVDKVIGYPEVIKLREKLENATGVQCIPVFHIERGLTEFKVLCQNYKYIAIGTINQFDKNPKILQQLNHLAEDYGTKVHGLGYTRLDKLKNIGFYSVDSTTWNNASRFGELHKVDGKTIKKIRIKGKRLVFNDEVIKNNLEEWCKFQKYMEVL